jgi:DHA1 family bicyclomycin/chloramphenicol resistance-like MFS transporter
MKLFIAMMASMMASVAVSIDAMLPALQTIGADLGVTDPNKVQYIIVLIFAGMAAGQLICGPLSDVVGRKKILYGGLVLYALGSVVCMAARSLEVVLFGRLLQGLGVSGPYVCSVAIIRDKYSGAAMARIMSLVMMIFVLVPSLAPALGQAILLVFSWRYIFALYLVIAVGMGIWVYLGLEETLPPEKRLRLSLTDMKAGFREVLSHRITCSYMVCMGLAFGGFMGYLNSSRQIFQDLFGTGTMFSAYFGGLALVFGFSSLVNARVVAAVGMRRLCRLAVAAVAVSSALFMIYCHLFGTGLWPFIAYAAVLYFAMGLMFGNLNALAMEPMGHIAGIASAVIGATSSLISLSLGTAIGQAYDGTLMPVTAGFLGLNIVSWLLLRHAQHEEALEQEKSHAV